jgi:DNA-directed RNA polymerase specialized sigma24 family protein
MVPMSVPVPLAGAGPLVAAGREGDPSAFEELLAPILVPAHRLAFTMLAQREAAEDAVQEAALKAWKAVATHLSSEKRLVLALVYWLDLPIEEVARVLGVSQAAARSRLRRAVLALRSAYTTDGDLRGTNLPAQSGHAMSNRFEEI